MTPTTPIPPRRSAPVVWRLSDGKRGHDNQSLGLCEALSRRLPSLRIDSIELNGRGHLAAWLVRRFPPGNGLANPDLIIAAGHATHTALLAARRQRGGRSVVLMRPSLPLSLFDLAIIPRHDRPPLRQQVLVTEGSLNRIRPVERRDQLRLILLGGPARGRGWDGRAVLEQLKALDQPPLRRIYATSRRTPDELVRELRMAGIMPILWQEVDREWLPGLLPTAEQVWVTDDSVNMVYEALSAGVAVGLIDSGSRNRNKLSLAVERLASQGWITSWRNYQQGQRLQPPASPLAEADRCADWIVSQWLNVH